MASLMSKAVIAKYRMTRRKRVFADARALRRSAESNQTETSQLPGWVRAKFDVTGRDVHGHRCYTLRPRTSLGPVHIFYLHGGAYVHQIESAHWKFLDRLIDLTGASVTVPLYPLAPAHSYRETIPMVWESYEATVGAEAPENQVVMGDSAGGALSLFIAQRLKARGRPQPQRVVLISPWLDITVTDPSMPELDRHDPYLGIEGLREAGRLYARDLDPHDARLSPIYGDLDGLAPLSVYAATRDVLLADARRLRELTAQRGVGIDYEEYPGMFHGWILQSLPEARDATTRITKLLNVPSPAHR
ncbi:Acetyl esterase/lipase [Saccharopolyspora antimicrobica]|uniref:Acetyl esterase/lipase n=1 Tax=Saccharopolyspora antimicrobica TaxID=455193 RepID=A0A1I4VW12_9PSEU|nr:alpha/beta hydrolase [Saccharopolyspora antimicrobica]RKT87185.1 acetyl esterase/lipase [Saccharopolyspora antimicrobica]SFN05372.1 Acetyl esterase/lipase [Saccharopolyspora antimicrobica]